jgi:hypothetical protein
VLFVFVPPPPPVLVLFTFTVMAPEVTSAAEATRATAVNECVPFAIVMESQLML